MKIGSQAFNFEMLDQHGNIHKLTDYIGEKNILLSFHIFSFTKGCNNQMTVFRSAYPKFKKLNTEILGVSCDAQPTQTAYSTSLGNLPYPVLSDFHPKGQVAKEFDIYNEDRGTSDRAVFIIKNACLAGCYTLLWLIKFNFSGILRVWPYQCILGRAR